MRDDDLYPSYEDIYNWSQWHKTFQCPDGHGQMTYWEGTIDQDEQGNNIAGCFHYCETCGFQTETEEL